MPSHVIIGGGAAGDAAASALRERDSKASLTVLSEEDLPFYTRLRLPDYLAGRVDRRRLVLHDEDWYRRRDIDLRLETEVSSIDPDARTVALATGETLPFDALLVATGARCNLPPVPGLDRPGVFTIRSDRDVDALREAARGAKKVAAIGGGLLGLEMSVALKTFVDEVTVLEVFPWLLPRQLDPEGGKVLQSILEGKGLAFRLDAKVEAVEDGPGGATSVRLESGEVLPAQAVLVTAGVTPRTALAEAAGLETGRGVRVDDAMRTSAPGVFAAGDCAEHRGRTYGFWPAAEAQGRLAGAAMAGEEVAYPGTVASHTLKVTGVDVFSAGDTDPEGKREAEVERGPGVYRKLVRDENGRLVGAVLVGDVARRRDIQKEIAGG